MNFSRLCWTAELGLDYLHPVLHVSIFYNLQHLMLVDG